MSQSESEILWARLGRVLRRRKRLVAAGLILVLAPVIAFDQLRDPIYEASTSLIFDEIAAPVPTPDEEMSRELALSNRIEEISSYAFARDIVLGLPAASRRRFPIESAIAAGKDTVTAIAKLVQEGIDAAPQRASNVVRVTAEAGDPETACVIANLAARVAQERNAHIRQEGAGGVRRFIEEQLSRTQKELEAADTALREYKQQNGITVFDNEAQEMLRRATEAEVLYNASKAERGAAEQKLTSVRRTLEAQKQRLVPSISEVSTPTAQRFKDRLLDLQSQQVDLQLQGYPATHPKLQQLQQDIDATKRDLAAEAAKLANADDVVDPLSAMQKYSTDAAALEIDIESSRAQEAALRKTIDGYDQALQRLPEKEFQLARLTRERDVTHKIYSMLLEKLEEARIAEAERLPSCRVIDIAQPPSDPVRPRKKLDLALGLLLGGLVGTGFAFGWETWRGGVESTAEMEKRTGWKVLASLPRLDANSNAAIPANDASGRRNARSKRGLIVAREPNSGPAEAFRMLRTALQFEGLGESARTLLVTSVGPADGKSTTISNLALSFAAAGHRIAIVDAEVRRPVQHEIFGMDRSPGLTEWLRSETPTRAVLRPTSLARVDLLSTGQSLDTPGDALVARVPQLRALLDELRTRYEVVFVDAPPLLVVHDTTLLARLVDCVLFVVRPNRADQDLLSRARALLTGAGARVIGCAMNHVDPTALYGYKNYTYEAPRRRGREPAPRTAD